MTALGSGFIIDSAGYIVTNNHVIDGASEIHVTLSSGKDLPAKLIGADKKTDLALLKVEAGSALPSSAGAIPMRPGSATGCWPWAIPSVSAAR
jgi:Trypsin-like serine proteases, typically periplasmic, contain C-terminal PDZ domain